jgi:FAD/FMN-containing dehydrogenase
VSSLSALAAAIRGQIGDEHVVDDPEIAASYETDWTGRFRGRAGLVARPANTEELAAVVTASAAAGAAIVPQGGNTGLVGGGVPRNGEVVVSTRRMTGIEDTGSKTEVVVSAGLTLAALQRHAGANGLDFGVDLAARDSATIGGMIATNAGGIHVLRWGRMRAQVRGLELVLHDGQVLDRLAGAPDKAIHDVVDLMVGSEGTLGLISRARVKLVPRYSHRVVALLSLEDLESAVDAASILRDGVPDLSAVEYFGPEAVELVRAHRGLSPPFSDAAAFLLVEVAGDEDPSRGLYSTLADVPGITDSAVAVDPSGRQALWELRESITESINAVGVPHKYDLWLPLPHISRFEQALRAVTSEAGARLILFGHLAEGSLHANVLGLETAEAVEEAVYRLVLDLGGSMSSEHGVGAAKVEWQRMALTPTELRVMRSVKRAFDPSGLLNPGVLLPADDGEVSLP